jgi:rhodanese-related sulfurtransferase
MRLTRLLAAAVLLLTVTPASAEDFPLRAKYPAVAPITVDDLAARFGDTVVVDVRSKFEFDTIHVADAVFLPLKDQGFAEAAKSLQGAKGGKTLAFYCNGIDCAKSYDAADICQKAGLVDVKVFDAGVFEWAKAHPDRAARSSAGRPGQVDQQGQAAGAFRALCRGARESGLGHGDRHPRSDAAEFRP